MSKQESTTTNTPTPISDIELSKVVYEDHEKQEIAIFKRDSTKNMILISWSFCFVILGVKIANAFSSSLLGNLGSISISLLNFGACLSFFIIPSILSYFSNFRFSLKLFAPEYGLYIMTFSYLIPILNCCWSVFHGFCASILWTCETMFLDENSTNEDRGFKSGLFWGIYMIGSIAGNIFVFFYLKYVGYNTTVTTGWLGSLSVLFLIFAGLSFVGCIFLFLFKPIKKPESLKNIHDVPDVIVSNKHKTNHVKLIFKGFLNPRIMLLVLPSFCWGYQYGFSNSMFNRQVIDRSIIGLVCAYNGFIQVLYSFVGGKLIDKLGHYCVFVFTNICMILAAILTIYANQQQNWLLYVASTFLAVGDAGYQTIIPVLITQYYSDKQTTNAILRIFQNLACSVSYMIAICFVEDGETRSTEHMYLIEVLVMIAVVLLSQISYSLFMYFYDNKSHKIVPHQSNNSNTQPNENSIPNSIDLKNEFNSSFNIQTHDLSVKNENQLNTDIVLVPKYMNDQSYKVEQ